jgi:GMP synthase-like glutamine amidotransferase
MTRCLLIQHVEPERAYAIGDALGRARVETIACRVFDGDPIPATLDQFHGVVVMGGPMSATSDDGFPTRAAEIHLLTEALRRSVPVLGVCLGAQLLARAGGAEIFKGENGPEVGWGTVELSGAGIEDRLLGGLPTTLPVLHWHGDTYKLPDEAVHLASSNAYLEQAFRLGSVAWGFQFHVEVDLDAVESFLSSFGEDAFSARTTPEAIREDTQAALEKLRPSRDLILDRFASVVLGDLA